jgi:hypothetical protein
MRTAHGIGAVVASLAVLLCGSALAGSMTSAPISIDKVASPEVIALPDITVTFGNNLTYQDDIFIAVDGATVDTSTYPFAVTCTLAAMARINGSWIMSSR